MRKTKKVLAAVLALSMALAMNVTCAFAEEEALTTAKAEVASVTKDGDTVTVSIKATGNLTMFDFGLVYDQSQMTVAKDADDYPIADWDSAFSKFYAGAKYKGISTWENMCDPADAATGSSYIVIGGTSNDGANYDGVIFTATFKVTGDTATLMIVPDSKGVKESFEASGTGLTLASAKANAAVMAKATVIDNVVPADPTAPPVATDGPTGSTGSTDPAITAAPVNGAVAATAAPVAADDNNAGTTKKSAKTGDASNVVLPIIVICAAAAAVVVASKKKVEE